MKFSYLITLIVKSQRQVNRQNGAGLPAEWFAAGRKICAANAPLQTVRVERMVMFFPILLLALSQAILGLHQLELCHGLLGFLLLRGKLLPPP